MFPVSLIRRNGEQSEKNMQDLITTKMRMSHYEPKVLRSMKYCFYAVLTLLALTAIVTLIEFQKVASMNYQIAHSFVAVH